MFAVGHSPTAHKPLLLPTDNVDDATELPDDLPCTQVDSRSKRHQSNTVAARDASNAATPPHQHLKPPPPPSSVKSNNVLPPSQLRRHGRCNRLMLQIRRSNHQIHADTALEPVARKKAAKLISQ
eukprot:scaffold3880_cov62-Cyclotella_meneghiniana.AAC.1